MLRGENFIMKFKKLVESKKLVTIGNKQYEIRYTQPSSSELASYNNENGLEYLGTIKYRGKVYDRYDTGFSNLFNGVLTIKGNEDLLDANIYFNSKIKNEGLTKIL